MPPSKLKPSESGTTHRPPERRAGGITALLGGAEGDLPSLLPSRLRSWVGAAVLLLVAVGAYLVTDILVPFIVAFAIAGLLDGQLRALEKRGYSRLFATTLVFVAFVLIVVTAVLYAVPLIVTQLQGLSKDLPGYVLNANRWFQEELQPFLKRHHETLQRLNLPEDPQELIDRYSGEINAHITAWMRNLVNYITTLVGKVLWLVIIPIITFFAMVDLPRIRQRLLGVVPEGSQPSVLMLLRALGVVWSGYLRGLTMVAILYGVTMAVLFSLLGLRYSIVLGVLAGLMYLVPYLGALAIAIISGLVAFFGGETQALWVFAVPQMSWQYTLVVVGVATAVNTLFDQLLVPRIVGGSVGIHPIASLFALLVGAKLFGIWGMLFAIPVTASLWIVLLALFPSLRAKDEREEDSEVPLQAT